MAQTKTGRQLRWYFNGATVGMGRMTMLKPDFQQGLDPVKEVGNPDIVEYALKVPETTLQLAYNVINKAQLAKALGQTVGIGGVGEVPNIPESFDIVERRLKAGTEGSTAEVVEGYTLYQGVQVEKEAWDQEVDKLVAATISAKCRRPRDFEGINGILFDKFTGNGVLTAFVLTQKSIKDQYGFLTLRAETPLLSVLREGVDYTTASTSSNTTVTFNVAPASSTVPNILVAYAW